MTLKPCPACKNNEPRMSHLYPRIQCANPFCALLGPHKDFGGAKWNALPRAEDAAVLLAIAKGCHDYNGGHHEHAAWTAFHHGVDTVINCIEKKIAGDDGYQMRVLQSIGERKL